MKFFRKRREPDESKRNQFESVLMRLVAAQEGALDSMVTADNCMQAPTVRAIVNAVANRIASTPIHVYRKETRSDGREIKEPLPNHPVSRLLKRPNSWQTSVEFWLDATSTLLRHGQFYSYKARGSTGPIRELSPIDPRAVTIKQSNSGAIEYWVSEEGATQRVVQPDKMFTARFMSRNYLKGDSPIEQCRTSIALEIMAERFGATFFQNGALPLMVFKFMEGSRGFRTEEQEAKFIEDFQQAFGGSNKHRAMLLPKGIESGPPVQFEHDKAQFIETRKFTSLAISRMRIMQMSSNPTRISSPTSCCRFPAFSRQRWSVIF